MKKRPTASGDSITPQERGRQIQDMILKRAGELRKERRISRALAKLTKREILAALKKHHYMKRCKECHAMIFYLKNGDKK